jgi:hypothetical protein
MLGFLHIFACNALWEAYLPRPPDFCECKSQKGGHEMLTRY